MVQTIINENEILVVVKKTVGTNGQITIGKEHAGKQVMAYVTEVICLKKETNLETYSV